MYKKRFLVSLVILLLITVVLVGCSQGTITPGNEDSENGDSESVGEKDDLSSLDPIKLTLGHMDVAEQKQLMHGVSLFFKEVVEKESNGKITVEVSGAGALGDVNALIEQATTGQIQMVGSATEGSLAGYWRDINVLGSPYVFYSADHAMDLIDSEFGEEVKSMILKNTGLKVAFTFPNGGLRHFTNSKHTIKTPDDMKGLKFRTMDNPAHMAIVEALGGVPTPIAWTETYNALQTHVVDGQENGIPSCLQGRMQEVQKYITTDGHVASFMFVLIDNNWFEALPTAYKEILDDAFIKSEAYGRRKNAAITETGRGVMVDAGMEIYDLSMEEHALFKEATKDVQKLIEEKLIDDPEWMKKFNEAVEASAKSLGYN